MLNAFDRCRDGPVPSSLPVPSILSRQALRLAGDTTWLSIPKSLVFLRVHLIRVLFCHVLRLRGHLRSHSVRLISVVRLTI